MVNAVRSRLSRLTSLYDLSNKDLRETRDYLGHRLRYLLTQRLLDQLVELVNDVSGVLWDFIEPS